MPEEEQMFQKCPFFVLWSISPTFDKQLWRKYSFANKSQSQTVIKKPRKTLLYKTQKSCS
jgi:hypothetical protein